MKLSIVVPVFGVEKYIEDCIRSCIENIGMESSEVEVVVVDDGSKDKSIEITSQLTEDKSYFRIITQSNQGLSAARNTGLEAANGEYVWFLDSDDFIAPGIVGKILTALNHFKDIDLLDLKYALVEEGVDRKTILQAEGPIVVGHFITGRERFIQGFSTPVPFHVYRKQFLDEHSLRMYPGIYHEDSEFTPRAVWLAKKVAVLPEVAYYYRQRENSIMTTPNPKKGCDYIFVAKRLQDFFKSQEMEENEIGKVSSYISMTYTNGLNYAIGASKEQKAIINAAAYDNHCVLSSLKYADQTKYRALGFIGSLFPKSITAFYLLMMCFH